MRRSQKTGQPIPTTINPSKGLVTEVWRGEDENALGGLSGLRRLTLSL